MAVPPTQAEIDDLAARRHRIALQEVANAEAAQLIQMKHTAAMLAAIERMDSANTGITGSVDQDDGKDIPPHVRDVADEVPGLLARLANDIYLHKFKVTNLSRLHCNTGEALQPQASVGSLDAKGQLRWEPPAPEAKDFKNNVILLVECLGTYKWIFDKFHQTEHPEASLAIMRFINFVCAQAQVFQARAVVAYTLNRMANSLTRPASADNWETLPKWETAYFTLSNLHTSKRSADTDGGKPFKKPRAPGYVPNAGNKDEVCGKYNSKAGCAWPDCNRQHVCFKCGEKHPMLNCK